MEILCTRPGCPRPLNVFADLDNPTTLKTTQQKHCTTCGMPLILAGRYLPSRLLGKGGFGAAFLACDRYTPTLRSCVVKQFQPAGTLNPQALAMAQTLFEREAEVLERLGTQHPQIPDLYAFFPLIVPNRLGGQEDQFFYLVQEFIDGQTLEEELATQGVFSQAQAIFVLEEMLKVLQFVHQQGVIHRDIKPSNIMRNRQGRLYLLDFGAVKQIAAATGSNPVGQSTGIYSMGFAPPEQMTGGQVYPATDLYALAVTCLMLLTGKPAEQLYDAYHNTWNWKSHVSNISDRLKNILDRLLLPAPKDRFPSATEVLRALQLPTPPTPSPTPPTPPLVRRASFSTLELLGNAAFTGFEGVLLLIALESLLPTPGLSRGLLGMIMAGLLFAQYRRIIEKADLIIIAAITLGLVGMIQIFHKVDWIKSVQQDLLTANLPIFQNLFFVITLIALLAGLSFITLIALFRLIYQILARFL